MVIINAFIAGIFGTLIMTLFMIAASVFTGYNFQVPAILGSMATFQTRPSGAPARSRASLLIGNILHYTIGVFLAFVYEIYILKAGVSNTFSNAILYGIIAGCCAVLFWFTFIKLHPLAPAIKLSLYLFFIFIGHLFFAMGVWLSLYVMTLIIK
jgi:hypothetical protein